MQHTGFLESNNLSFCSSFQQGKLIPEENGAANLDWTRAQRGILNMSEKSPKQPWLLLVNQTWPNLLCSHFFLHLFPSTSLLTPPPTCSPADNSCAKFNLQANFYGWVEMERWTGPQKHESDSIKKWAPFKLRAVGPGQYRQQLVLKA